MDIDIVIVTYNSSKWVEKNIKSILASEYDTKKLNLYIFDNFSKDDTIKKLEEAKKKYSNMVNTFKVIIGRKNYGFGVANNKASKYGNADYVFFLNVDTEVKIDTFKKIAEEIQNEKNPKVGVWELKQQPYEHPKYYNPVNGEVSWFSGACFVIRRELFKKTGGFDKNIFMYCEDVELSWHVRKLGYCIKYLCNVPINHYSYENEKTFKINQYVFGITNNLYLRYKYGSVLDIMRGYKMFLKLYLSLYKDDNVRKVGIKKTRRMLFQNEFKVTFLGISAFFL
jgi:GT2 family glycosyltransferase